MIMPEAAMNEDNNFVSWEHDVGGSRQAANVDAESEASCKQKFSDCKFRLGVLLPNPGHDIAPLLLSNNIGHLRIFRRDAPSH